MLYLQIGNFQKIVRRIGGAWMTANQATFLGSICVVLIAVSIYIGFTFSAWRWMLLLVPVFLLLRMVMNTLDGMLSREYKTATVAGEIWNEMLDVVGDTIAYGSLFFIPHGPRLSLTLYLILTWAAGFIGILGKGFSGGRRRHETIGGGKPDRAVWIGMYILVVFFKPGFIDYLPGYLLGISVLILLTSIIRINRILREARGKNYESYTWIGR